jgi:L-2-hydroxyglutarate oxidase LhgO
MTRELTKEEAIGALKPARVPACVSLRTTLTHATRPDADALQHIHAQLGKVAFMEPVFWERKEGTHSLLLRVSDGKTDCSFACVVVFVGAPLSSSTLLRS